MSAQMWATRAHAHEPTHADTHTPHGVTRTHARKHTHTHTDARTHARTASHTRKQKRTQWHARSFPRARADTRAPKHALAEDEEELGLDITQHGETMSFVDPTSRRVSRMSTLQHEPAPPLSKGAPEPKLRSAADADGLNCAADAGGAASDDRWKALCVEAGNPKPLPAPAGLPASVSSKVAPLPPGSVDLTSGAAAGGNGDVVRSLSPSDGGNGDGEFPPAGASRPGSAVPHADKAA